MARDTQTHTQAATFTIYERANPLLHTQSHTHTAAEREEQESTHKFNSAYGSQPRTDVRITGVGHSPEEKVQRRNEEGTHAIYSGLQTDARKSMLPSYLLPCTPTMLQNHRGNGQSTNTGDEEPSDDVDRGDQPERELVQNLVAVIWCLFVSVVWFIDTVHPHTACKVKILIS